MLIVPRCLLSMTTSFRKCSAFGRKSLYPMESQTLSPGGLVCLSTRLTHRSPTVTGEAETVLV